VAVDVCAAGSSIVVPTSLAVTISSAMARQPTVTSLNQDDGLLVMSELACL
jgi:hypothetical protein